MILAANISLLTRCKIPFYIACFLFVGISFSGCFDTRARTLSFEGPTMGTRYSVTLINPPSIIYEEEEGIQTKIEKATLAVNGWMSNYLPDSEISKINRAPTDTWLPLSAETYSVIETAQEIAEKTSGSFDITVSPLVNLWGFGPDKHENPPTLAEIDSALAQVGWRYVQLDPYTKSLMKTQPVTLDLSAIAKGFGVDYICDLLDRYGVDHYLVEIGGEVRVKGFNADGNPWRIGIESPTFVRSGVQQSVAITNKAIATSGDYRNYYEKDGIRYSHTIDPNTGRPVEHNLASVTVVDDSATEADAWATAFNVMGPDKAIALAEKNGLAVYVLSYQQSGYNSRYSSAFAQYVSSSTSVTGN